MEIVFCQLSIITLLYNDEVFCTVTK